MITIDELNKKFPKIGGVIERFYPLGLLRENPEYLKSPQGLLLSSLIDNKILNDDYFDSFWRKGIIDNVQKHLKHEVIDITYGPFPNFGGMIVDYGLSQKRAEKCKVFELHFYVSLVGNYFTIQIAEIEERTSVCEFTGQDLIFRKLINLTVSPYPSKHNNLFLKLESTLRSLLKNFFFLPYCLDKTKLMGLNVLHTNEENCNLGDAFFRKILPDNQPESIKGDTKYCLTLLN